MRWPEGQVPGTQLPRDVPLKAVPIFKFLLFDQITALIAMTSNGFRKIKIFSLWERSRLMRSTVGAAILIFPSAILLFCLRLPCSLPDDTKLSTLIKTPCFSYFLLSYPSLVLSNHSSINLVNNLLLFLSFSRLFLLCLFFFPNINSSTFSSSSTSQSYFS